MSGAYASLYGFPQTGLCFFTAYDPWGRPDMACFGFTREILAGGPIEVFGEGRMARDFTHIDTSSARSTGRRREASTACSTSATAAPSG